MLPLRNLTWRRTISETIIGFALIFIVGELLALPVFSWLRRHFLPKQSDTSLLDVPPTLSHPKQSTTETLKGVLERFVVTFGLFINLPGILTVFAALKLANRLSHESDKDDDMINYFLIGNLITVLFCLSYFKLASEFAGTIGAYCLDLIITA